MADSETRTDSKQDKKQKKSSIIKKTAFFSIFLGILVFIVVLLLVFSSLSMGKNNSFSVVSAYVPAERIPPFSSLAKSESEFVRDAFVRSRDEDLVKEFKGRTFSSNISIDTVFTDRSSQTVRANITATGTASFPGTDSPVTLDAYFTGKAELGAITVNLGDSAENPGIIAEMNVFDQEEVHMQFVLSDSFLQTIQFLNPQVNLFGTSYTIEDIEGQVAQVQIYDLVQFLFQSESINEDEFQEAYAELNEDVRDDFYSMLDTNFLDFDSYSSLSYVGRETIGDQSAVVVTQDIRKDEFKDVVADMVNELRIFLRQHDNDLVDFCRDVELFESAECRNRIDQVINRFSEDSFANRFISYSEFTNITDITYYVSPIDNTLLGMEYKVEFEGVGMNQLEQDLNLDIDVSRLVIEYDFQEIERDITFEEERDHDAFKLDL
ncbi:MAG: hypothetical protein ACOCXT_01870 [Candidatus Dojkabacteria bacterium]